MNVPPHNGRPEPEAVQDWLYELLPAYIRHRDWHEGEPLRALMQVLEGQYRALEADIYGLYDDWFIETCRIELAALLGDLVGAPFSELQDSNPSLWLPSHRALVANWADHRRRRGTVNGLAHVLREASGWNCTVTPGVELASATHSVSERGEPMSRSVSLRNRSVPDRVPRRITQISGRTGRPSTSSRGAAHPGRILLAFDRQAPIEWRAVSPRRIGARSDRLYTLNPLGLSIPLHMPGGAAPESEPAERYPIDRMYLSRVLRAHREGEGPNLLRQFGFVFQWAGGAEVTGAEQMHVADLSDSALGDTRQNPSGQTRVWLDPELGRLRLAAGTPGIERATYWAPHPGSVGATPLPSVTSAPGANPVYAPADADVSGPHWFPSVDAALSARPKESEIGLIRLTDSGSYRMDETIELQPGRQFVIEAVAGELPTLLGDLTFTASRGTPATATIRGVQISGTIRLQGAVHLRLAHCTVLGEDAGVAVEGAAHGYGQRCSIEHSLVAPLAFQAPTRVRIVDSVVSGPLSVERHSAPVDSRARAVFRGGATLDAARVTFLGPCELAAVERAEDCIFAADMAIENGERGAARHCYFGTDVPPVAHEHCVFAGGPGAALAFVSTSLGAPAIGQLTLGCSELISHGATNGNEMGAFQSQRTRDRRRLLSACLDEFLPVNLAPVVAYRS